jgi:hypothetical protein
VREQCNFAVRLRVHSGCLATFQAAALGSGRQSAIEQPTITATSRVVTGTRRGKCHRQNWVSAHKFSGAVVMP